MLLIAEEAGAPLGLACKVDASCPAFGLEGDDWSLLIVVYPEDLAALGVTEGGFTPVRIDEGDGRELPLSERSFVSNNDEPDLAPIALFDAELYRRYRLPNPPCPTWSLRWSSRAGAETFISAIVPVDPDRILVFGSTGEVIDVRTDSAAPEHLLDGPIVFAATADGNGAIVLTSTGAIGRVAADGVYTELALPRLPQSLAQLEGRVLIAGSPDRSLVVQLAPLSNEVVSTATVWTLTRGVWSTPLAGEPRMRRRFEGHNLVEGLDEYFYSSLLGPGPMSTFKAEQAPRAVDSLTPVDLVVEMRRYDERHVFATTRRNQLPELHRGELGDGGAITWQSPVALPSNEDWRCTSSSQNPFLCATNFSVIKWPDRADHCAQTTPPIPKDAKKLYPLGDGWLVYTYENIDEQHFLQRIVQDVAR